MRWLAASMSSTTTPTSSRSAPAGRGQRVPGLSFTAPYLFPTTACSLHSLMNQSCCPVLRSRFLASILVRDWHILSQLRALEPTWSCRDPHHSSLTLLATCPADFLLRYGHRYALACPRVPARHYESSFWTYTLCSRTGPFACLLRFRPEAPRDRLLGFDPGLHATTSRVQCLGSRLQTTTTRQCSFHPCLLREPRTGGVA